MQPGLSPVPQGVDSDWNAYRFDLRLANGERRKVFSRA
jgi:hypothetical protein